MDDPEAGALKGGADLAVAIILGKSIGLVIDTPYLVDTYNTSTPRALHDGEGERRTR